MSNGLDGLGNPLSSWLSARKGARLAPRCVAVWPYAPGYGPTYIEALHGVSAAGSGRDRGEPTAKPPCETPKGPRCDVAGGCGTTVSAKWRTHVAGTWCDVCWQKNEARMLRKFPPPVPKFCDVCGAFTFRPPLKEKGRDGKEIRTYYCGFGHVCLSDF